MLMLLLVSVLLVMVRCRIVDLMVVLLGIDVRF